MDNVKTKKLTSLISKLTIAANKAAKKQETKLVEPRTRFASITGLNGNAGLSGRGIGMKSVGLLRS